MSIDSEIVTAAPPLTTNLLLTPTAFAKWRYLRDCGPMVVGGYGLTDPDDSRRIVDVILVPQRSTSHGLQFDDATVEELCAELVRYGVPRRRFQGVWLMTHADASPLPTDADEAAFREACGPAPGALLAVLARNDVVWIGRRKSEPLRASKIVIDWERPFKRADHDLWEQEYRTFVCAESGS